MFNENQISFGMQEEEIMLPKKLILFREIIIDRGSKYTVVGAYVTSKQEVQDTMKYLLRDKYFQKSTHNTYAYRFYSEEKHIIEGKNDDGETGAGMCILREMQRAGGINMILVVTRYFGGVYLQADRFKNVIEASKIFFDKIKKMD